jgi:hypothetical protein
VPVTAETLHDGEPGAAPSTRHGPNSRTRRPARASSTTAGATVAASTSRPAVTTMCRRSRVPARRQPACRQRGPSTRQLPHGSLVDSRLQRASCRPRLALDARLDDDADRGGGTPHPRRYADFDLTSLRRILRSNANLARGRAGGPAPAAASLGPVGQCAARIEHDRSRTGDRRYVEQPAMWPATAIHGHVAPPPSTQLPRTAHWGGTLHPRRSSVGLLTSRQWRAWR